MKKSYIFLYLMLSAYFSLFSMETSPEKEEASPAKEGWVFVKNMPGIADSEDKDRDWRIKDQKLELNLNAREPITQETFAEIIKDAKDKKLPFILLKVQSGDKGQFIHFFNGTLIKNILANLRKEVDRVESARSKEKVYMQDPVNRQKITNMEIYVVGDDGKLRLLKDNVNPNYLENFVYYDGLRGLEIGIPYHLYKFKPELTVPGKAQAYISLLYEDQVYKMEQADRKKKINMADVAAREDIIDSFRKQEKNLRTQLALLQQQKNAATLPEESESLSAQINNIEMQIDNIVNNIAVRNELLAQKDPQIEKLRQLERLWISWALDKFSPADSRERKAAAVRMEEIEYKPQHLED